MPRIIIAGLFLPCFLFSQTSNIKALVGGTNGIRYK